MNFSLAKNVKEEIDKMLKVGFIYPMLAPTWLLQFVVAPKNNENITICVE